MSRIPRLVGMVHQLPLPGSKVDKAATGPVEMISAAAFVDAARHHGLL